MGCGGTQSRGGSRAAPCSRGCRPGRPTCRLVPRRGSRRSAGPHAGGLARGWRRRRMNARRGAGGGGGGGARLPRALRPLDVAGARARVREGDEGGRRYRRRHGGAGAGAAGDDGPGGRGVPGRGSGDGNGAVGEQRSVRRHAFQRARPRGRRSGLHVPAHRRPRGLAPGRRGLAGGQRLPPAGRQGHGGHSGRGRAVYRGGGPWEPGLLVA
mmetsp:Transcript_55167/g.175504  ORF Transcript_55167/g.175504 Transcript_55167/m.175504 type:complete len:212 (+) Transcript_55167:980-1615(+)